MSAGDGGRYAKLVETANEGAKTLGKLPLEQRVRLVVDLHPSQAAQLARLAMHVNRTPAELVTDAVRDLLAAMPRGPR